MKHIFFRESVRTLILSIFLLGFLHIYASVKQEGWTLYPSFDKSVIKIMDTDRYVYFLVHSQLYLNNTNGHKVAAPILFRKDKLQAESDIRVLYDVVDAGGTLVSETQYDPVERNLLVVYQDLAIDIIRDDDSVITISGLQDYNYPGRSVNAITFDTTDQYGWIATNFGFVKVDMRAGKISEIRNLNKSIINVCTIGQSLLILTDDGVYEIDKDDMSSNFSDYKPVKINQDSGIPENIVKNGTLYKPFSILPLSNDSFAAISVGKSGSAHSINLLQRDGDGWSYTHLVDDKFRVQPTAEIIKSEWECNLIPNSRGYYIYCDSGAYQLTDTGVSYKKFKSPTTFPTGSWDFNTFWLYEPRKGFYWITAGSNASWDRIGQPENPVCSPCFIADKIVYSPKYGFVFTNNGPTQWNDNFSTKVPPLVTGIKDGVIGNFSPAYNQAYFIETNSNLSSSYQTSYADTYPLYKPKGVTIDPAHPDYVYISSSTNGMARLNLADMKQPILHLSRPNDEYKDWPGFIPFAPQLRLAMCCFSQPDYDNDGNFFASNFSYGQTYQHQLWYWTKEDKEASEKANINPSEFKDWHIIELKHSQMPKRWHSLIALRNNANKNLIVLFTDVYGKLPIIYNHKGTLSDTSDDVMYEIPYLNDDSGNAVSCQNINRIAEDPITGMVWVLGYNGCFYFDPVEVMGGNNKMYAPSVSNNGSKFDLFSSAEFFDITRDDHDRLWLAGASGVWCLDSELREVVANYNSDNSPLPSNRVYSICWNPETQSLLMSTDKGLAEVVPSETGVRSDESGFVRIYPDVVYPHFTGNIIISGIEETTLISDAAGREIVSIAPASTGKIYWNACDADSERLPSGRYHIRGKQSGKEYGEIILLK